MLQHICAVYKSEMNTRVSGPHHVVVRSPSCRHSLKRRYPQLSPRWQWPHTTEQRVRRMSRGPRTRRLGHMMHTPIPVAARRQPRPSSCTATSCLRRDPSDVVSLPAKRARSGPHATPQPCSSTPHPSPRDEVAPLEPLARQIAEKGHERALSLVGPASESRPASRCAACPACLYNVRAPRAPLNSARRGAR